MWLYLLSTDKRVPIEGLRLKDELEEMLKENVDIAALNTAPPTLKMHILKKGIPVYIRHQRHYCGFFVDTLKQYWDLKQTIKICEEKILRGRIYAR